MPGSTPIYGLSYPIPTDLVINGPATIQQLAEDVETVVDNLAGNTVPSSRQVATGSGLSGGGDLSANRILTVDFGTLAGTAAQGNDSRIVNAVQNTRQVLAGQGLTGGGDLTTDRTLGVNFGSTGGTVAEGNDSRLVNSVQGTRQVIAGTGLSGGGALSSDVTLNVNTSAIAGDVEFSSRYRALAEPVYVSAQALGVSGATRDVVNDAAEVIVFADSADGFAIGSIQIPSDWANARLVGLFANASTGAGDIRVVFAAEDADTGTSIASITSVGNVIETVGLQDEVFEVTSATFAVAAGIYRIRVGREGTDLSDTLGNDVHLLGVRLVRQI